MLASLGAAALAAPTASATPIAGDTSSAAGVVIRFRYAGSRNAPVVDLSPSDPSTGSILVVDTRTGLPAPLVGSTISIDDLTIFRRVDVSTRMVPVPEPSSAMLLSLGVALIAARRATRR